MRTILLLLALACSVLAAPPKAVPLDVSGDTVVVVRSFPITITAPKGGRDYTWFYPATLDTEEVDNFLRIKSAPKGTHKIRVKVLFVDLKKPPPDDIVFDRGDTSIVVGDVPGPVPPDPGPKPPDPPVPIDGPLRVLIVYESAEEAKMPEAQRGVMYGKTVRDWLNANCAADGTVKAWRIWDKDTDAAGEAKHWQAMLARSRVAVPFVHVFRGDVPVHEGPLPATPGEMIALLDKIKGGR